MRITPGVHSVLRRSVAAGVLVVCGAGTASAQWTRHHPSRCQPQRFEELELYAVGGAGGTVLGGAHPVTVICATVDSSEQPDSGITRVRVYVVDHSETEGFRVRACRTLRDTTGSVCSEPVSTGDAFTGDTVLTLDATALAVWNTTDFGYLEVRIPRYADYHWSYFKGWISEF
jgi:hypothetical protein